MLSAFDEEGIGKPLDKQFPFLTKARSPVSVSAKLEGIAYAGH